MRGRFYPTAYNRDVAADPDYKKMMTWVAIALAASVIAALIIVELVIRRYEQ